jgi:hypothetical protein
MGIISRGTATRLINCALSTTDVVPQDQATLKKLYGTMPQRIKSPKSGTLLGKILVNTNVSTPIITRGFKSDHSTPSDMFR